MWDIHGCALVPDLFRPWNPRSRQLDCHNQYSTNCDHGFRLLLLVLTIAKERFAISIGLDDAWTFAISNADCFNAPVLAYSDFRRYCRYIPGWSWPGLFWWADVQNTTRLQRHFRFGSPKLYVPFSDFFPTDWIRAGWLDWNWACAFDRRSFTISRICLVRFRKDRQRDK